MPGERRERLPWRQGQVLGLWCSKAMGCRGLNGEFPGDKKAMGGGGKTLSFPGAATSVPSAPSRLLSEPVAATSAFGSGSPSKSYEGSEEGRS